jgi:hypothetical protein
MTGKRFFMVNGVGRQSLFEGFSDSMAMSGQARTEKIVSPGK